MPSEDQIHLNKTGTPHCDEHQTGLTRCDERAEAFLKGSVNGPRDGKNFNSEAMYSTTRSLGSQVSEFFGMILEDHQTAENLKEISKMRKTNSRYWGRDLSQFDLYL